MTRRPVWLLLSVVGTAALLAGCSGASSGAGAGSGPAPAATVSATSRTPTPPASTRPPIDNRSLLPGHLADAKLGVRHATADTVIQPHDRNTGVLDASNMVTGKGLALVAVVCFRGALTVHVNGVPVRTRCTGRLQILAHLPAHGQAVAVDAQVHERQGRPWALGLYSGT
jgi:hypothetical protein